MKRDFTIEVEVGETERKNYLEKLRELFLKKGFIVEQEWEDNIIMSRPFTDDTNNRIKLYPWIDKIYIQGKSATVAIKGSMKYFYWFRKLLMFVVPIVDIYILFFLFFFISRQKAIILIAIVIIASNVIVYFILNIQYKKMVRLLEKEIRSMCL